MTSQGDSSIAGLVGASHSGREETARTAGGAASGRGPLPVKGDSFRIERIPLDNPEEKFWGRFDSAPRPLLRPKERPAGLSFGNLSEVDGGFVTGDVGTGSRTGDADCHVASLLAMTFLNLCHSEEACKADAPEA